MRIGFLRPPQSHRSTFLFISPVFTGSPFFQYVSIRKRITEAASVVRKKPTVNRFCMESIFEMLRKKNFNIGTEEVGLSRFSLLNKSDEFNVVHIVLFVNLELTRDIITKRLLHDALRIS